MKQKQRNKARKNSNKTRKENRQDNKEGKKTRNNRAIYIYAVKLKTGPRFGGFIKLKIGPSLKLKTGPSFSLFPHFYSVLGVFLKTQIVSHCAKIVEFWQNSGDVKNEVVEKKIALLVFCLFYVGEIETEKRKTRKTEKAPKP